MINLVNLARTKLKKLKIKIYVKKLTNQKNKKNFLFFVIKFLFFTFFSFVLTEFSKYCKEHFLKVLDKYLKKHRKR